MDTDLAIRSRRTVKQLTGAPVARHDLEELLELACWAPNHRLTEPWRFHVVEATRVPAFAQAVVGAIGEDAPDALKAKRGKLAAQLAKLGAFVAVTRARAADPATDREDYAACACAAQNILLGATARGIGTYWSTGAVWDLPPVRAFLGIPAEAEVVAAIWLGVPADVPAGRRRPWRELVRWA